MTRLPDLLGDFWVAVPAGLRRALVGDGATFRSAMSDRFLPLWDGLDLLNAATRPLATVWATSYEGRRSLRGRTGLQGEGRT